MSQGLELTWLTEDEENVIALCSALESSGVPIGRISKQGAIWAWQYTPPSGAWKGGPAGTLAEAQAIIAEAHSGGPLPTAGLMPQPIADASKATL